MSEPRLRSFCHPCHLRRFEAEELLDFLGLKERLDHKPNELSGGEQQRVAVARALINKPLIVFADEPTGNLDTQTSSELHGLLAKLKNERAEKNRL